MIACISLITIAAAGCADSPSDVCWHVRDLIGRAFESCGFVDYETAVAEFDAESSEISGRPGTTCDNADGLRERESLEDECIPWLEAADCDALASGTVPPSCIHQILFFVRE